MEHNRNHQIAKTDYEFAGLMITFQEDNKGKTRVEKTKSEDFYIGTQSCLLGLIM